MTNEKDKSESQNNVSRHDLRKCKENLDKIEEVIASDNKKREYFELKYKLKAIEYFTEGKINEIICLIKKLGGNYDAAYYIAAFSDLSKLKVEDIALMVELENRVEKVTDITNSKKPRGFVEKLGEWTLVHILNEEDCG